jgi:hypothetical protein
VSASFSPSSAESSRGAFRATFQGVRRGDAFHTVARYETAAPQYAWLNRLLAAGSGAVKDGVPTHAFDEIL